MRSAFQARVTTPMLVVTAIEEDETQRYEMRFTTLILIGILPIICLVRTTNSKSQESVDYLAIVRAYADGMIEHGRDVYGHKHSPLFAEELDRKTMRMLEGESLKKVAAISRKERGIRSHDRMLGGINPQHCENLYQILFQLSEICDEKKYSEEAERFAHVGVELFLNDTCPLPKASHVHDHYEAVTNGDTLMMAFLKLWLVKNRPESNISLTFTDR